jgi:hypothetical protein
LNPGDVLISVAGASVASPADVKTALAGMKSAGKVKFEIWRDARSQTVTIEVPGSSALSELELEVLGDDARYDLRVGGDYWVDEKQKQVHLTEVGHEADRANRKRGWSSSRGRQSV